MIEFHSVLLFVQYGRKLGDEPNYIVANALVVKGKHEKSEDWSLANSVVLMVAKEEHSTRMERHNLSQKQSCT
jgi:hypothetical protein